jgi:acyl-CoA reductase-like NAD-dependent aldehyde dehydrogenase
MGSPLTSVRQDGTRTAHRCSSRGRHSQEGEGHEVRPARAGAAFGGYKIFGGGRETHKMMPEHYSRTKNLLVSCSTKPLGLF